MTTIKRMLGPRRLGIVFGVLAAASAFAAAASADDISNSLDASVDAEAEVMALNVGGDNGITELYLRERNGDGKNGCNLNSGSLVVSVASSDASVAVVNPASVTFEHCGDRPKLTVTAVGQGSATISVAQTSNTSSGTFNLAPASFTVNVTAPAPANTAPTITVADVTGGASYAKGAVPAAACEVTDAEDGNKSFPATLSAISGPYASDGIGAQTASCSYTDGGGGLTASASQTYSIFDPSDPTIGYTISPPVPDGDNGWYRSDVSLAWTVTEPESPNSLHTTGCVDQSIKADQVETTYSCEATSAGGYAGPELVTIKRDATKPISSGSRSPGANTFGWNNGPVDVAFACADNLSGVASCGPDTTITAEGADQSATGTAVDNAGNSDTATVSGINIDLTAPGVTWNGAIADGDSFVFGTVPAAPTCTATDDLSGPNGCSVGGYSTEVGTHTLTATAHDKAGNENVVTRSYTVLAWTLKGFYQPVDMNGVLNTVKNGSTVPLKFDIFAGATELTDTANVKSLTAAQIGCDLSSPLDDVETTATGGTSLRYDATGGQFIYNWQTPKKPGYCYRVTMMTQDASTLVAHFKLK